MQASLPIFEAFENLLNPSIGEVRALVVPNDDPLLSGFSSFLTKQQRARCRRYHHAHDRRAAMVCKGLWRVGAGILLDDDPRAVPLDHDAFGRPILPDQNRSDLDLNVSRTHTHCALALSRGVRVGVDVERVCPELITESLVDAVTLSDERTEELLGSPDAFFGLWTRKEAVLKGDGRGLSVDPRRVCVPSGMVDAGQWRPCSCHDQSWFVTELSCPNGVMGAVGSDQMPTVFQQVAWTEIRNQINCADVAPAFK